METVRTDICILGAGSAGLSLAAGAVQMGARVVLVEGHRMGGDCLNYGCVPSKALLAAAKRAHAMGAGGPYGVAPVAPEVDFAAAKDHVARAIAAIAPHDSQERFEGLGVEVIRDWGRFVTERAVEAGGRRIEARRFVIATGSRPAMPPIPGIDTVPYLTNETLFDLRERPAHLMVIGGGPIGMEMAQAHARLGARVTVLEAGTVMARDDSALVGTLKARLAAEGVEIREGVRVTGVSGSAGAITLQTDAGALTGSHLMVAAGREVQLDRLDLAAAGVAFDAQGVTVDRGLRSVSNRRVYAIGDAAGGLQFTHLAGYHASVVIRAILFGLPAKARTDHVSWVTYTDPELAQIGLTEAAARARHGRKLDVIHLPLDQNDRAQAEGATDGAIKLMVVSGRPVGVSILAPHAGELIGLWALVLANRLKLTAVANMVAPYPTLGEIGKRAAGAHFAPKLFESAMVKRVVGLVQRFVP